MALAILATTCQLTLAGRGCSCANGELLATPGLALLGGASWRWSQMPLVTNQWPEDQRYSPTYAVDGSTDLMRIHLQRVQMYYEQILVYNSFNGF